MELREARTERCPNLSLLRHPNADLSAYQIEPGDDQIKAELSLAQLKELLLTINELSCSISDLQQEAEERRNHLSALEEQLWALDDYEGQATPEPGTAIVLLQGAVYLAIGMVGCVLIAVLPSPWSWVALFITGIWYAVVDMSWSHKCAKVQKEGNCDAETNVA